MGRCREADDGDEPTVKVGEDVIGEFRSHQQRELLEEPLQLRVLEVLLQTHKQVKDVAEAVADAADDSFPPVVRDAVVEILRPSASNDYTPHHHHHHHQYMKT